MLPLTVMNSGGWQSGFDLCQRHAANRVSAIQRGCPRWAETAVRKRCDCYMPVIEVLYRVIERGQLTPRTATRARCKCCGDGSYTDGQRVEFVFVYRQLVVQDCSLIRVSIRNQ